jgi:hypothetical protein
MSLAGETARLSSFEQLPRHLIVHLFNSHTGVSVTKKKKKKKGRKEARERAV